ncbi:soluble quino protein glucose dehydrogenase [Cucurbitaria berberidis CBS 394.84]|uniref:Soluble quino protein glucose dehydrogenase n=1 Tax=Cucurbitaria berberidis CBS 394.84 TaxID=1168544 RepID=A0A9P4L386_9PLEO|nr:soluble quino protein glucose dehydrogenase [Cucurbitaria berberidis CBS 394.84]KAF1840651.1 soluble quino protein glucose dehydrogenase [Cucurbitaria berberidis CBS 394.84]
MLNKILLATAALQAHVLAQSCPSLTAQYPAPSVASDYEARLVAQNLDKPRGLIFDNNNNLLVVEREVGVTAFKVEGAGSCVTLKDKKTVVSDGTLNHGIELSEDGKTLYASSRESVLKYNYDSTKLSVSDNGQVIVKGMTTDGQVTRTLLLSRKSKNTLLVSRGSDENIDLSTVDVNSGQSQIRIFDPSKNDISYTTGTTLGWGLRNAVGLAENPTDGGIWSAENNADNIERDGFSIHENNPAEELNYHGKLEDAKNSLLDANYGYPLCYGAWNISEISSAGQLQIGDQFAIAEENATRQDAFCNDARQKPRLVFQPHTSPIDIKFDTKGENLYVSLRGSWNRNDPVGYSVSVISFSANGEPTKPSSSTTALTPIFSNSNTTACPGNCFRPAGLAWDRNGRLYVSSDATGEIYVITKSGGDALDATRPKASAASKSPVSGVVGVVVAALAMAFAYLL